MTKKEKLLALIRAEVAEAGKVEHYTLRRYTENRISYLDFMKACRQGIEIHNRRKMA